MVSEDQDGVVTEKKSRKRFKKIFGQIQQQMEFYFSDANLRKDRFLKKMVTESQSGDIPLEIFMKFNRIKSVCTDETMLAKALRKSKCLVVNDKGSCVRRKVPLNLVNQSDVDERTVYVECLPPNCDHEVLKKIFGAYGNVVYVSLPRYKTSGDLKDFAFIEFETKEGASKALEKMTTLETLEKAGRFPKMHNKQFQQLQKQAVDSKSGQEEGDGPKTNKKKRRHTSGESTDGEESGSAPKRRHTSNGSTEGDCGKSGKEVETTDTQSSRKRKRQTSECSEEEGSGKKGGKDRRRSRDKTRKSDTESECEKVEGKTLKGKKSRSKSNISSSDSETKAKGAGESDIEKSEFKGPVKGILKQESHEDDRGKKRKFEEGGSDSEAKRVKIEEDPVTHSISDKRKRRHPNRSWRKQDKGGDMNMKVLSKKQWLSLRDEYLSLQKASMNSLKKSVQQKKAKEKENKVQDIAKNVETDKPSKPAIEFTPNVIVHVKIDSRLMPMSRQQIKLNGPSILASSRRRRR